MPLEVGYTNICEEMSSYISFCPNPEILSLSLPNLHFYDSMIRFISIYSHSLI